jgi:hypothetical protein
MSPEDRLRAEVDDLGTRWYRNVLADACDSAAIDEHDGTLDKLDPRGYRSLASLYCDDM